MLKLSQLCSVAFTAGTMLFFAIAGRASEVYRLSSPDSRIQVLIEMPAAGSRERPRWSATFQGKQTATNCALGLQTPEGGELMAGVRVVREKRRSVSERIPVLFGRSDHADNRYHEIRFTLETAASRRTDVTFRCFNDAVAMRYELPTPAKDSSITITDETTSFGMTGEPIAFAQYLENFNTSHEHNVTRVPWSEIRSATLLDLPLTFSWPDGVCAAITEASLRHYAGMSLMRSPDGKQGKAIVCQLTPRPDGTKVIRPLPMETPWRVLLMGERPGALLESETLYCLNDPPAIKDVSWIKPGKITFHWWNGNVYDGKPGPPMLSFEMSKKYIDFCAGNGIPTDSITSTEDPLFPWYAQSTPGIVPGPDTDVTRPRAGFDLAAIRRYAETNHVRLWTWVHQAALRGRVEEAYAAFEKLGWSGMMVDFFDHDDQDSVELAESILQAAARHHIMIHFHGVWKPTGLQRTYPNLMNHEGALNLEYLKWTDRCTPEHNLLMAFTRLVAGPMDYHLGGFRAVPRAEFRPHYIAPTVLGTRCHHLAMYVCFDNPNPMVADYPTAYEGQPGFDFLKLVPTWWDETRVIAGEIGSVLATARRKGSTWYLGGMSAGRTRELDLPLSFLGSKSYAARIWTDAPDAESNPNHLETQSLALRGKDTLKIKFAPDGGFVAELTPTAK